MPQHKGVEPYTQFWRVKATGVYRHTPSFSQQVEATLFEHRESDADAWVKYFQSIRLVENISIEKVPIHWLNRWDWIQGTVNGVVSTIWCGVSGFSIG